MDWILLLVVGADIVTACIIILPKRTYAQWSRWQDVAETSEGTLIQERVDESSGRKQRRNASPW